MENPAAKRSRQRFPWENAAGRSTCTVSASLINRNQSGTGRSPLPVVNMHGAMSRLDLYDDGAIEARLRKAGLRPTRQRIALVRQAFAGGDRHFSAEALHAEAQAAGNDVSLATVYNTLHHFTEAGMLRILSVEGTKTWFDTNTSDHHHFFVESTNRIFDIDGSVTVGNLPPVPEGMEIAHVDVVIRLRPKTA
jgi:Fur family transcriptional regulator, iron response regulator